MMKDMIRKAIWNKSPITACLLAVFAIASLANAQQAPLAGFDDFVRKCMHDWEVPGVSIAIVKDDKIVYLKSFGVQKIGEPAPVDEHTLFAIGSASKAFTATAIASLVDEGKLKWDEPVSSYLKGFRLPTSDLTAHVTARDLLSHRTGIGNNNIIFWGTPLTTQQLMQKLAYLEVHAGLREQFEYNNLMYMAAGEIVPAVTGTSWASFIRQRLFQPLGMSSSIPDVASLKDRNNLATGHRKMGPEGKVLPLPLLDLTSVAPAGAILSNAQDMAQWVRFQLGNGTFEGKRILQEKTLKEMHRPQIFIPGQPPFSLFFPESVFSAYGLGWMLSDYRGHKIVQHGGDTDSMASLVALMPDQNLGVVIFTNMEGPWMRSALMLQVFDAFLGSPPKDWNSEYLAKAKDLERGLQGGQTGARNEERIPGTKPSLTLDKYAGTYSDLLYGPVDVTYEDGALWIEILGSRHQLEHWNYDTFRVKPGDNELQRAVIRFVGFGLDPGGRPFAINIPRLGEFKRKPEHPAANN